MYCAGCETVFENLVMSYDEMIAGGDCPLCTARLQHKPGRFKFEVKDSQRHRRQVLEARFKKRAKRIEKEFTPEQKENFENWCRERGCKRYY
jgi:hypothetical protein